MNRILRRKSLASNRFRPEILALEGRALLSMDVLTFQDNNSRTGANLQETTLTSADVNATSFGLLANVPLDGKVDAQTLYVSDLAIPNLGTHDVLYIATENDSVYALDADTGEVLWHDGPSGTPTTLLPAGEVPVQATDLAGSQQFGSELGILDTPVIDPTADTLYVEAESRAMVDGSLVFHQRIHAIDITTGAERVAPRSIDSSITYPGQNPLGNGSVVSFDPMQYKERDALTLSNGVVYTGWASNADIPPYTGWVIGFRAGDLSVAAVLNIDPNGIVPSDAIDGPSGNTFWNSGGGFSVDSAGNLYNASANGPFDAAAGDYGDSIIKFSTANGLAVSDYFTPYNQQMLSNEDGDIGSSDVILLPDLQDASGQTVHLAVTAGKDGSIYVVNRDDLGQFNATSNAQAHQVLPDVLTIEELGAGAYFNGQLYYGANSQPLRAFTFTNSLLSTSSTSQTSESFPYPGTSPSISADGNTNGIVWAVEDGSTAVLHAFDASNLADELYNSNQAPGGRDQFGADSKFIVPTIADGHVFVGTQTGVAIFGLLSPSTPVTPAPPAVLISAFSSSSLLVGGLDLLGAVGADSAIGEPALTYTWSAVAIPAGAPTPSFSANGTNAAKLVSVGIARAGSYTFQVAIADTDGQVATSDVTIAVALPVPSIAIAPFFSASPRAGTPVLLGVLGEDPLFAESSLTYTWVAIAAPSGAPSPTFSSNFSDGSKLEVVNFSRAGTYTLRVAVANPFDEISLSDITVVVGPGSTLPGKGKR